MFANLDGIIKSDAGASGEPLSPDAKDKRLKPHIWVSQVMKAANVLSNHLYFSMRTETHEECDLCSVDPHSLNCSTDIICPTFDSFGTSL